MVNDHTKVLGDDLRVMTLSAVPVFVREEGMDSYLP